MEVLRCPACASPLNVTPETEIVQCKFCGNSIRVKVKSAPADSRTQFVDKATQMPLGSVQVGDGFEPACMIVPNVSSYTFPIEISCSVFNTEGTVVTFFTGEAYTDRSKCAMLSSMYANVVNSVNRVVYKEFAEVDRYLDMYAMNYAKNAKATSLNRIGDTELPIRGGFNAQDMLETYKNYMAYEMNRTGNADGVMIHGYYQKPLCRVYEIVANGVKMRMAIMTVVEATKYSPRNIPQFDIGSMFGGFGSMFGMGNQGTMTSNGAAPGSFGDMQTNNIIEWRSNGVFMLHCRPENFDKAFRGVFTDFVSSFKTDRVVLDRSYQMQNQIMQDISNATQQNLRQQQQQFQAWQQIHRTQQAAFDSYNQGWWDRQNASYQANRARSQAAFYGSSGSGHADYSEAIRGVNTYVRDDGTEVEVSVAYDRAFQNASGDVIGTSSTFDPGGNWTEIPRA